MKIALAQINTTVGDFQGNCGKIEAGLDRARRDGVDLVVFPEQAVLGYPAEDLLEREDFLRAAETAFSRTAAAAKGVAMVVGTVLRAEGDCGNPIYNSAAFVVDGRVAGVQHKTLLPTYDVFDEGRYFRPASSYSSFPFQGRRIGLLVCEDLWNDPTFWPQRRYPVDPVQEVVAGAGADLIVAISASPFSIGRLRFRMRMVANTAVRHKVDVVYCNLVGGNTSLVFDGASFALDPRGRLRALAASFAEDYVIVDLDAEAPADLGREYPAIHDPARIQASESPSLRHLSDGDLEDVWHALTLGTRDYLAKTGFRRAVVGLSGGVDSALTAALAVEALGAGNVTGFAMPSRYSSEGSLRDSRELASRLGIELHVVPIEDIFTAALGTLAPVFAGRPADVTEENIQARIRGLLLMAYSNKTGALVLTTGNKSELAVGYCTLYGDMSGGLAVISDVPKVVVYQLARWVNRSVRPVIPQATLDKAPSAELRPNQKDEDSLPPYDLLDPLLEAYIEDRMSPDEIVKLGYDRELVTRIVRLVDGSEYKRKQAAPGLRVTSKAFGGGRRLPIAERFHRQGRHPAR